MSSKMHFINLIHSHTLQRGFLGCFYLNFTLRYFTKKKKKKELTLKKLSMKQASGT